MVITNISVQQNWGDAPFTSVIGSWYWGHAHLGDYSLVWFSVLTPTGANPVSTYVSKDHKILTASCNAGSITVRPTGANDEYPPSAGNPPPGGYTISTVIEDEGRKVLNASVDVSAVVASTGPTGLYYRMIGSIKGSIEHGPELTGVALFEQFALV